MQAPWGQPPSRLLPRLLSLPLAGCGPEEEVATAHRTGPPRPGPSLAIHKTPSSAPSGATAIGSPGAAKVLFADVAQKAGLHYCWPSGHVDVLHHILADRQVTLREGNSTLK